MIWTKRQLKVISRAQGPGKSSGFTLIELLVVVAIIVLISMVAMPTVSSYFQLSLNSATREMATLIKEAYNSANITGNVHRMAYDLKENTYWVEMGPRDALLDTKESTEKENRHKRLFSLGETKKDSGFSQEKTISRKKSSLPRGVIYEDVITQQSKDPRTEGIVYTHFFPNTLTEQTLIHLKDQSDHHASLIITPLLGMSDLYDRYVKGTEVFEKQ